MVTTLKNKCSVWKRIKFPTFWYNCYYFTWSDTYFIQLETLLINHPSYMGAKLRSRNIRWGCSKIGSWRKCLGLNKRELQGTGCDSVRNFIIWPTQEILFGRLHQGKQEGKGMWHVRGKVKVHAGFWRRGLSEDITWKTCVQVGG